ncbi:MAG TPA: ribbon-helix-helix domain-containing protein [Candidatus Nanoarchaeia archaeon]|nr:ribbon-helix-helix domain-containing protein [Candidatus Nanoarchaeia archaeon]
MVTEMITLKLEKGFLKEVDKTVKERGFHNRTEFIRNALRENMNEARMKEAYLRICHLKGASKKKITDEEIHVAKEKAFEEIAKRFR